MSKSKLSRDYHCWDDCVPTGCPGHTATLEYVSTSDALHFSDGKGQNLYGQPSEFGALVSMLYELATYRSEIEAMLESAKEGETEC